MALKVLEFEKYVICDSDANHISISESDWKKYYHRPDYFPCKYPFHTMDIGDTMDFEGTTKHRQSAIGECFKKWARRSGINWKYKTKITEGKIVLTRTQ